ncbi:MAG: hypothetical protein IT445_06180 [Phycisphaeraceae bacterium]|nr:hypothetical protein [Phycisphaeraceae bacterium]
MGSIYREQFTKPIPQDAKLSRKQGRICAEWVTRNGKKRRAEVVETNLGQRLKLQSQFYHAKYRDGSGIIRKVATKCRTREAAMQRLAELERDAEKVRSGVLTSEQERAREHQQVPLAEHIVDYLEHLKTKLVRGRPVSPHHIQNVKHNLDRVVTECQLASLSDLEPQGIGRWMTLKLSEGVAPATINRCVAAVKALCAWCYDNQRLSTNPLTRLKKLNEQDDKRRKRRALSPDELQRLLTAARLRPLAELVRPSEKLPIAERKGRRSWHRLPITANNLVVAAERGSELLAHNQQKLSALRRMGEQRELIYRTLVSPIRRCPSSTSRKI